MEQGASHQQTLSHYSPAAPWTVRQGRRGRSRQQGGEKPASEM